MAERPTALGMQQRALAAHLRDPRVPVPAGIEPRRLAIHRDLLLSNIDSLLAGNFQVIRATLSQAEWQAAVRAFHAGHRCRTPLFTEIGREFVRWLDGACARDRSLPPWLAELAHYEWVELALDISDAEPAAARPVAGGPAGTAQPLAGVPVVSRLAWALAYRWPVHRIGPDSRPAVAPAAPTLLLVRRDDTGQVRFAELAPLAFRLLELLAQPMRGRDCLRTLAVEAGAPDQDAFLDEGAALLRCLADDGTIRGIRPD